MAEILKIRPIKETEMPDYQVDELVATPIGAANYKGFYRLHGQTMVVVATLPGELLEMERRIHGKVDLEAFPEEQITRLDMQEEKK